jgi:putative Holliday junction resolvase
MKVLGIDWGKVRLGMALSDPTGLIASPARTIKRKGNEHDIREILRIVADENVEEIVVGNPLDMKGQSGKAANEVADFARKLKEMFNGPVHLVDERFSTHAAERSLIEADVSRERRRELRDSVAAAWILQGFLDARNAANRGKK